MDTVIIGGRLIDGSGVPWRHADVGIDQGRVAAIGDLADVAARQRIDAHGRIVCPGFIDTHSHADLALLIGRDMRGRLGQGITTEVVGQDGLSYAPVSAVPRRPERRRA
jgi:N-acyl-D-amino-acid deacylase